MKCLIYFITFFSFGLTHLWAAESLSYSGRLVNANGSPVTGSVNLQFELGYTTATPPIVNICSQSISNVPLTNGVFHVKLEPACSGGLTLSQVILATPLGESLAIRVTDQTHTKTYSYQALYSMPVSLVSKMAKQLEQMGASNGQVLAWDGTKWAPTNAGAGSGTVTSITAGTGLTATATNPITNSGTISIANGGVGETQLATGAVTTLKIADDAITNVKVSTTAAIDRSKLAAGTANAVLVNNTSGVMSEVATLPLAQGGTGANSATGARTNLGLGTAAVANMGYASGNVLPSDNIPVCLPTQKLLFTGVGPSYWSCAADIDTNTDATKLPIDGSVAMGGALDMGMHKIFNVISPDDPGDAANKAYVDAEIADAVASIGGSQWSNNSTDIYYNSGRVGIGTISPQAKLDVQDGVVKVGGAGGFFQVGIDSNDSNLGKISFHGTHTMTNQQYWTGIAYSNSGGSMSIGGGSSLNLNIDSGSGPSYGSHVFRKVGWDGTQRTFSESMRINGAGNVGIGTPTPNNKLEVNGDIATSGKIRLKSDTANYVELRAPSGLGSTLTFTMPSSYGTSGYALTSDGVGGLTWSAVSTSSSSLSGEVTGTLSSTVIASDTITSAKIVDGTITGSDIANGTIPYAKLNIADADIPLAKINGLVAALAGKEPAITAGTSSQYWRGDKTWQTLDTSVVPENGNLYFLDSRVRAALMSGYTMGSALPIAATDTLMEALGKLEASLASVQSSGLWTAGSGNVYRTSGNVGIGTAAPTADVQIANATDGSATVLKLTSTDANFVAGQELRIDYSQNTVNTARSAMTYFAPDWGFNFYGYNSGLNSSPIMTMRGSGNVGIGTTAPGELLHVANGNVVIDNTYGYRARTSAGSYRTLMSLNANNDLSVGTTAGSDLRNIYLQTGTGFLNFTTGGNEVFRVTNTGNVGIGTTTPTNTLVIRGSNTSSSGLKFESTTGTASDRFSIYPTGNTSIMFQKLDPNTVLSFANSAGGEEMRIGNTGNIGIGTTTPTTKLEVNGTVKATAFEGPMTSTVVSTAAGTSAAPSYSFSTDSDTGFYSSGTNTIGISAGGSQVFTFGSTGLTSPTTGGGSVSSANGTAAAPTFSFAGDPDTGWFRPLADTLAAATGGVERVRIDSAGKVGIGNSSPYFKLDVHEDDSDTHINIQNNSSSTARYPGVLVQNYSGGNGGGPSFTGISFRGNYSSPAPVESGDILFMLSGNGATNTSYGSATGAMIKMEAAETFSSAATGTNISFATAQAGSNSIQTRMTVLNNGNVGIGTANPAAKFQVNDGAIRSLKSNNQIQIDAADGTGGYGSRLRFGGSGTNASVFQIQGVSDVPYLTIATGAGNVGIGTTSPTALLDVASTSNAVAVSRISNTSTGTNALAEFNATNGTAAVSLSMPGSSFTASGNYVANWGLLRTSAAANGLKLAVGNPSGNITFEMGTSEKMRLTSAGYVGIGTASPETILDVNGIITSRGGRTFIKGFDGSNNHWITTGGAEPAGTFMGFKSNNGTTADSVTINAGSSTPGLNVLSSGFVGIGTTAPATLLHVKSSASNYGAIMLGDNTAGNNHHITHEPDGSMGIWLGPHGSATRQLTLLSSGNMGVGVSAPSDKLHVAGGNVRVDSGYGYAISGIGSMFTSGSHLAIGNTGTADVLFVTASTEKMRLTNAGRLGIGVASPSYKVDVSGDINASGTVRASGTVLTSDVRFKKDIHVLNNALDKILKLRGVSYNWRSENFPERNFVEREQIGVIAQEVEKVFPQLVDTDHNGYKSVNYTALIAPLIESTKALHARTKELETENAKKDREIASLKERLDRIEKVLMKRQ